MTARETHTGRCIPMWAWVVMVALSSIPPLTHYWIANFPPESMAPTGLHGGDSAQFIHCMRMFETGFFSPYTNCHSALGTHSPAHFAVPFYWMYAVVGAIGRALGLSEFMTLGWANGIGGFLYLLAAYLFLREAFPKQANLAFVLLALASGPGGFLYIITGVLGLHHSPNFEPLFQRYAMYQLTEGVSLVPTLLMPRLYYTAPLACCIAALTCLLKGPDSASKRLLAVAAALLVIGTLLNPRYGAMTWGVFVLYLIADARRSTASRLRLGAVTAVPVLLPLAAVYLMMRINPAYLPATSVVARNNIWLSPFLSATLFHLAVVPRQVVRETRRLPRFARMCAGAGIGYLLGYLVLYCLYNAYYGNVWRCLDFTPAVRLSDWALLGAVPGAILGIVWQERNSPEHGEDAHVHGWAALWLLAFLAMGISAFGQGWFLRLTPQRSLVMLALPIAVLAARGIQRLESARPRVARGFVVVMVTFGVCSIVVASASFQGPLGHRPGQGPFGYVHCELIPQADADALEHIDGGVVLTPVTWGPAIGDVVTVRPDTSTVFGCGTVCLSDRIGWGLPEEIGVFFSDSASADARRAFVEEWCVDYVYCPDCHPVNEEVIAALRRTPWLEEVTQCGKAVLFRVVRDAEDNIPG